MAGRTTRQKTHYLSSEQPLNLVKLLSPTNLRHGVRDERNAYFCNSDSGLPLRFTEFNDNDDLVRPLPRNRYLRAGNSFPFSLEKDIVDTIFLFATTSL